MEEKEENVGLFFDGKKNIFDPYRSSVFPFKTKDTHSDYLERTLTQDSLKIAPITENIPEIPKCHTQSRIWESLRPVTTPAKIDILQCPNQGK